MSRESNYNMFQHNASHTQRMLETEGGEGKREELGYWHNFLASMAHLYQKIKQLSDGTTTALSSGASGLSFHQFSKSGIHMQAKINIVRESQSSTESQVSQTIRLSSKNLQELDYGNGTKIELQLFTLTCTFSRVVLTARSEKKHFQIENSCCDGRYYAMDFHIASPAGINIKNNILQNDIGKEVLTEYIDDLEIQQSDMVALSLYP